ncbi:MAG: LysM peptidoglycan-binding domain-containing protein [Acidimicrobiales bacterium]
MPGGRPDRGGCWTGTDQRRPPVLALALVVALLAGGWPAADVVTGILTARPAGVGAERGDGAPTGMVAAGGAAGATRQADRPREALPTATGSVQVHRVRSGETYWSIATSLDLDGDPRASVDALVAANRGRPLYPGDHLALPLPSSSPS